MEVTLEHVRVGWQSDRSSSDFTSVSVCLVWSALQQTMTGHEPITGVAPEAAHPPGGRGRPCSGCSLQAHEAGLQMGAFR